MPLFEARDISVSFGGVKAVTGLSLSVEPGEIAGLIGPNGAGKTTFVDAVTGYVRSTGSVTVDGVRLDGLPPHRRVRAGVSRTWQNAELFDDLSVTDNVRLVQERLTPGAVLRNLLWPTGSTTSPRVEEVLDRLGIRAFADTPTRDLSVGQRKLVGLARAMASDARIILMDEPAAGLDSHETGRLREQLRAIAEGGVGILLIEHDMDLVLSTCETLHVMNMGRGIASGPATEVRTDPEVLAAYLGADEPEAATA